MDQKLQKIIQKQKQHLSHSHLTIDQSPLKLPPLSSRDSRIRRHNKSLSSYNVIDFSMENVKYKAPPLKYLSSKIDFFNPENQRKLDVSKRKILSDVGAVAAQPKKRPLYMHRRHNLAPQLHCLVQKYLRKKEEKQEQQNSYMVVGSDNKLYL